MNTTTERSLEERTNVLTKGYVTKQSLLKIAGIQYELLDGLRDSLGRNYAISKERLPEDFKRTSETINYERPFVEVVYKDRKYKVVATNSDIKKAYEFAKSAASAIDGLYANLEGIYQRQIKKVLEEKVRENKSRIIEEIKERICPTRNIEIIEKGVIYGTIDTKIQLHYQGKILTYELTEEDKMRLKMEIKNQNFNAFNESGKRDIVKRVLYNFTEEKFKQLRKRAGIEETENQKPKNNPNTKISIAEKYNKPTLTQKVTDGFKKLKFW